MIDKLKKIYRVLFPKTVSAKETLLSKFKYNEQIRSFVPHGLHYELTFPDGNKVLTRNENFSDYQVFGQIFNRDEYACVRTMMQYNSQFNPQKIIVDAGANVGYTSAYFLKEFPSASVFAIEPSADNFSILSSNLAYYPKASVKLYPCALSAESGSSFSISRDFRDGKDWSINTIADPDGEIRGISLGEIINENTLSHISFLKIDIEGAERFIFKPGNDLSFLTITEIISIEIHDEFDIREGICELLRLNGFFLFESGEITVGINRKLL